MPIEGDKPQHCFEQFREHIARIVGRVLSDTPPVLVRHTGRTRAIMSFPDEPDGGHGMMALETRSELGDIRLFIGQQLEAYEREGSEQKYTLRTLAYWYRIHRPDGSELFRWEYEREQRPTAKNKCRNHLHVHGDVSVRNEADSPKALLKDLHLPTGWVTIEEVLRFLFVDLGVEPAEEDWPAIIAPSEERFRNEFVPPRSQ